MGAQDAWEADLLHHPSTCGSWQLPGVPGKDKKAEDVRYRYSGAETYTAVHSLFRCKRWDRERDEAEESTGVRLHAINLVDVLGEKI